MQSFIYIEGKLLKTVSLDGISFDDLYNPHPMTITDDGALITVGLCKPHHNRSSPADRQRTISDNRSSTEDSRRSRNNDSVDHSDDGTEDMSGPSVSEEEEDVEWCLVHY